MIGEHNRYFSSTNRLCHSEEDLGNTTNIFPLRIVWTIPKNNLGKSFLFLYRWGVEHGFNYTLTANDPQQRGCGESTRAKAGEGAEAGDHGGPRGPSGGNGRQREATGAHGRQRGPTGAHGRQREATGDHGRQRGPTGAHGRQREATGAQGRQRETRSQHQRNSQNHMKRDHGGPRGPTGGNGRQRGTTGSGPSGSTYSALEKI